MPDGPIEKSQRHEVQLFRLGQYLVHAAKGEVMLWRDSVSGAGKHML